MNELMVPTWSSGVIYVVLLALVAVLRIAGMRAFTDVQCRRRDDDGDRLGLVEAAAVARIVHTEWTIIALSIGAIVLGLLCRGVSGQVDPILMVTLIALAVVITQSVVILRSLPNRADRRRSG